MRLWGVRGSIPVPGSGAAGFGGNTSCVQVSTGGGRELVLDAGTGIRDLGRALVGDCRHVDILLTHLHLDHIRGLLFFAPFFDPEAEVTVWGPPAGGRRLRDRLARYLSSPLSPVEIRDLPARVVFRDAPAGAWELAGVRIRAALVGHRGPTLGYRLEADAASLCYLPDHEPGLGQDLTQSAPAWISGHGLARGASLLIHDCQYTDEEYPQHRGWGHSSLSDAIVFARRTTPARVMLFHHDPLHDDPRLEKMAEEVAVRWRELGGEGQVELAREGQTVVLGS